MTAPRRYSRHLSAMAQRTPVLARLLCLAALLLCSLGHVGSAAAQSKLRMERLGFDSLPDLKAYLTFVEGDGTPIMGKNGSDFKLLLDSAEAGPASKVIPFDQVKEPIFIIAVVQLTPAVEGVMDEVRKGVRQVAETVSAYPGSRMGLLGYASDVKRLVESGNSGDVQSALSKLVVDPEGTEAHLLEALRTAIDLLNAQDKGRRKLIVLFSDGIDVNNDKKSFIEIGRRAQQAGVVIDPIGYTAFEGGKLRNLFELSKNSYGVDRGAKAPAEIGSKFAALVDEINKQYVATFALSLAGDDKEHGFQAVHDTGKPVYSQTFNAVLKLFKPAEPKKPPPPPTRWWLWALIIGGLVTAAGVAYALTRKKPPAPPVQPMDQRVVAPMPTGGHNKTVAIQASGDVVMGWLLGLNGPFKDKQFVLKARLVIGTAADCDIVLVGDGYASSRHCEIRQAEGGFKMVDLGSTNGLVVNDKKCKEHFLVDNDSFRVGRTEFKFKSIMG